MKKILMTIVITVLAILSFQSEVASAKSFTKKEDLTEEELIRYEEALEYVKRERKDVYIQDYYKKTSKLRNDPEVVAKMKEATAGATTDYEKAKAIYECVYFGYSASNVQETPNGGGCYHTSKTIEAMMQAAGFPTKYMSGFMTSSGIGHAWNEVFVDGRWLFVDGSAGAGAGFDLEVIDWCLNHTIDGEEESTWDGSLVFIDVNNGYQIVKEVKNIPLNSVLKSTYGFDIKELYWDDEFTKPYQLNKTKFVFETSDIYVKSNKVKPFKVTYNSNGGTKIASEKLTHKYTLVQKPDYVVKKGYKFVGWYSDRKLTKIWNFKKDRTSKSITLYAKWQKAAPKYKVTYQHNNGVTLDEYVSKNSLLTKPNKPSPRFNYTFVAWFKDSKCTQKWDFTKDKVTANLTLYGGWKKN